MARAECRLNYAPEERKRNMDFNDIGKKISSVGNSVMNRAKNATMLNDLKGRIAQEQKNIDGQFLELGRQYYSLKKEESGDEFQPMIDLIREGYERIAELEKQCESIQNTKICRGCGAVLEADARFCIKCGMRVEEEKAESPQMPGTGQKHCKYCGAQLPESAMFCNKCGEAQ